MARQITNAKPQDMMKTLSSFKKYIGYHKYALSSVAVLVIISTGINLWGTFQIRTVINQYLMPGDYQGLVRFIIFMIVICENIFNIKTTKEKFLFRCFGNNLYLLFSF